MAHLSISIFMPLIALLLHSDSVIGGEQGSGSSMCRFGGTEYGVGHVFHPRLETQGTVFCVTCQCLQGGRTNCSSRECPTIRCAQEDSSDCCRICAESSPPTPVASSATQATQATQATLTNGVVCVHNGKVHNEGDTFQSNNTGMTIDLDTQCVQCRCEAGLVVCEIETCDMLSCEPTEAVSVEGRCCPRCGPLGLPAAPNIGQYASPITFTDHSAPRERRDKDCISAGKYYMDGTSWHPVIGPLGPMDCVMCACAGGNIVCNRFRCPSKMSMSCSKPKKQFGQCCPVCPTPVGQQLSLGASKDSSDDSGPIKCVNEINELLVYRAEGAGNLSHFIQYAFQKLDSRKPEVELHSWVLHRGIVETFQTQIITLHEFQQLTSKFHFSILGASTSKNLVKFGRREKKIRKRCIINCILKIQQLEDNLSLQKMNNRKHCLATEIQFTPL